MNLVELAQRLKRLRTQRGLTLEEVASRAGLTRGWLSKVENFRVTPSLPALFQIAQALNVPLSELFEGLEAKPPLVVVRADQRITVRRDEELSELTYESLAHLRPTRVMDPFLVTVPPTETRPMMSHGGEEFIHVIEGVNTLQFDDVRHDLEAGDSVYFDGTHPHRIINPTAAPAKVLIVFTGLSPDAGVDELDTPASNNATTEAD
jgi:transcriptional regulator with XRE-family HTH domain